MSLNSLIKKRDELKTENTNLKIELANKEYNSKINDIIKSFKNYSGQRGGKYKDIIFLPDYESKWKGTFFDVQRPLIERLNAWPINRLNLLKQGVFSHLKEFQIPLIGHCDMVCSTKSGPIIRITDPYGSVTFAPLKKTTYETALTWLGRILIVHSIYRPERKSPIAARIQTLSFMLKEDSRYIK